MSLHRTAGACPPVILLALLPLAADLNPNRETPDRCDPLCADAASRMLLAAHRPNSNNSISLMARTPPSPLGVPIDFACSRSSTGSPESSAACGRCKSTVPTGRSAIALHHPAHDHSKPRTAG